jgi:hypothetical protein
MPVVDGLMTMVMPFTVHLRGPRRYNHRQTATG